MDPSVAPQTWTTTTKQLDNDNGQGAKFLLKGSECRKATNYTSFNKMTTQSDRNTYFYCHFTLGYASKPSQNILYSKKEQTFGMRYIIVRMEVNKSSSKLNSSNQCMKFVIKIAIRNSTFHFLISACCLSFMSLWQKVVDFVTSGIKNAVLLFSSWFSKITAKMSLSLLRVDNSLRSCNVWMSPLHYAAVFVSSRNATRKWLRRILLSLLNTSSSVTIRMIFFVCLFCVLVKLMGVKP